MSTLTFQIEGTSGNTVTAAAEGASGATGTGTMQYSTGGLFPGSNIKAVVTGDRVLRTDNALFDMTQPILWGQAPYRFNALPLTGNAQLIKWRDASANAVAMVSFRTDGKINLTYTGGPTTVSTGTYLGATFWIQHLVDRDSEAQQVLIYAANGLLRETVTSAIRPSSAIVDVQVGSQAGGAGTITWFDRAILSHDQPFIIPDGSATAGNYPLEGTVGASITVANTGATDVKGAGTAVYTTGGLVPGSAIHGLFTGDRFLRTDYAYGQAIDVRCAIQIPRPVGDSTLLLAGLSADKANVVTAWLKSSGKLELRYTGGGPEDAVTSSVAIDNDKPYWLLWQIRQAASPAPVQTLIIVEADSGRIAETVTAPASSAAIVTVDVGSQNGPPATQVRYDAITISVIPLSIPGTTLDPVKYVVVGACTPTSAVISIRAPGAAAVRALITGDKFQTTAQTTPDVSGRAMVAAPTLTPRQAYTVQPEIFNGTVWTAAGEPVTWRQPIPPGEVGTQLIAVLACQASKKTAPSSVAYDDLLNRQPYGPVDLVVWNGDQHYGNVATTDINDHLAKIDNILRDCQGMRDQHARTRTLMKRSDHDGGGDANVFYHGDAILASKAASRQIYPQYSTNGGDPTTDYEIWQEGRVLHIAFDCRSNNRSNWSDAETTAKTCLGLGQRDAVIAALTTARPADVRVVVIYSDMGWAGTGFGTDKVDAWSWYSYERDLIATAIRACPWPVFMMQDDWHTMFWADRDAGANTRGPVLVGGFAGTDRSTGNFNKMYPKLTGEVTGVYPPMVGGVQDTVDIFQYGLLKIVDSGPTISVTMIGRDAKANVDRVSITKRYTVDDPLASTRTLHRIVGPRGSLDLTDSYGRWQLLSEARPLPLAARTLGLATRPGGGSRLVSVAQEAATATITVGVFDIAEDGTAGALVRNRDTVYGVLGFGAEQVYQIGPVSTGLPVREVPCIVAAEATPDLQVLRGETYTVPMIYLEPWRSVAHYTWAAGLNHDLIEQELSPFTGSTAEVTDALISLRGPGNYFTVIDAVTGCGFRWNVPGTGTPLAAGAYVLVDTANWTSYVSDHFTFDPSEGVEHAGYITSIRGNYDPQGVLLPLTPAREADGVWRIRMTVQSKATTGETQISIRARARFR